jgi:hypothetical protein
MLGCKEKRTIYIELPSAIILLPAYMITVTAALYHSLLLLPLLTGRWMPCFTERGAQGIPGSDYIPDGQGLSGVLKR